MMPQAKANDLVRWFEHCGDQFVKAYRTHHIDVPRLTEDRNYGLKVFLFDFAFARSGAPHAYRVAAVKAASGRDSSNADIRELFKEFCSGKRNKRGNPVFDRRIVQLDVPEIVKLVRHGALGAAFRELDLRGVGHKIRALFLRDLVILLKAEPKLQKNPKTYAYCQPMDVWVRFVVKQLCGDRRARGSQEYKLNRKDLAKAEDITRLSLDAGVSPLKVNAGIWYFSSNVVADKKRLKDLVGKGDAAKLKAELALMDGFLPVRSMWGALEAFPLV
jgi:hypothetical protein